MQGSSVFITATHFQQHDMPHALMFSWRGPSEVLPLLLLLPGLRSLSHRGAVCSFQAFLRGCSCARSHGMILSSSTRRKHTTDISIYIYIYIYIHIYIYSFILVLFDQYFILFCVYVMFMLFYFICILFVFYWRLYLFLYFVLFSF